MVTPPDFLRGQKGDNVNESFVFYRSFAKALEKLPADQYKEIMMALCQYGLDGEAPELSDPVLEAIFLLVQPQIDANAKRRENGRKGASSRWDDSKAEANDGTAMATDSKVMASDRKHMATNSTPMPNANANANVNVNANDTTPLPPSNGGSARKDPMEERFERFWFAYPKKTGKGDARKAFLKIKPSSALLERMLSALAAASASYQWQRDKGRFIPNPSTWLNQQRWEDEVRPDMGKPDPKQAPQSRFHNLEQRPADDIDQEAVAEMKARILGRGATGG